MSNFVIVPFQNRFHLVPDTDIALSLKLHCVSRGDNLSRPTLAGAIEAAAYMDTAIARRNGQPWITFNERR